MPRDVDSNPAKGGRINIHVIGPLSWYFNEGPGKRDEMKLETEIRNLKRELKHMMADRDYWRVESKKWENAYKAAKENRDEWEDRFDELLTRVPKVTE